MLFIYLRYIFIQEIAFIFSFSLHCVFVLADHLRKLFKVTLICDTVTFI